MAFWVVCNETFCLKMKIGIVMFLNTKLIDQFVIPIIKYNRNCTKISE